VAYLCCGFSLYFLQERLIFPAAYSSIRYSGAPPAGTTELKATTVDGETLTVWRSQPSAPLAKKQVAIIFHGNGETVANRNFMPFLNELGIIAYGFDYRGYGTSTGSPSPEGILRDADSVWELVKQQENIQPDQLILLGNSIGSGPASYLAQKTQAKVLVLIAAYSSLQSVVAQLPIQGLFLPFLRYSFPTAQYVSQLRSSACVVLAHGERDQVIPFSELNKVQSALPAGIVQKVLISREASHNDIFYAVEEQLHRALKECMTDSSNAISPSL
jgi:fermentation-respiration switch protein FrsA (DUF1100 family)